MRIAFIGSTAYSDLKEVAWQARECAYKGHKIATANPDGLVARAVLEAGRTPKVVDSDEESIEWADVAFIFVGEGDDRTTHALLTAKRRGKPVTMFIPRQPRSRKRRRYENNRYNAPYVYRSGASRYKPRTEVRSTGGSN